MTDFDFQNTFKEVIIYFLETLIKIKINII